MIYRVVLDDTIDLHTSDINCMLLNPSLDLEMNSAGSFNFTLPPSHPYWDDIKVLKSTIDVYEDGDLIFTGRIASIEKNWNNERVVQCEGALAYFNDSIHRQMKWETPLPIASEDPTVHNFLKDILDNHNVFEGAENANRHIFIGNITVDPEVVTREVNYDTTLDILTRMCIDTNGGYMSVRKDLDDGKLYLDWIKDFTDESGQPAQFGLNLLNFDTSLNAEDICTGVLARGAEVNDQTVMLNNVELVDETTYPDMSVTHYTDKYQDILWHREGVAKFGQVVQVHDFSDAQTAWKDGQGQIVANSLFEMAKKWLEEKNTKIETIEVEVAELAWLGEGMPKYKLGQIVELSDDVHMAGESYETRLLPMYKLSCDLNSGSKKVTLGTPPKKELTQISASNSDSSTLSSSGSSSGSGGSGEGEECRVHDVRVDGTSVVSNKIANISLAGKADVSTVNALATTVASKADASTVNALATVVASKQDQIEFNTQEAATEVLTRLKADGTVYNLGGGTEVEANPSESATDDLNTIKIGNTVYDIPGGGSTTNYGKFKCDVLFVNDPLPSPTSGTANVTRTYTLNKSIDDYDAVYVIMYGYYYSSQGATNITSRIVFKNDYYLKGFDNYSYYDGVVDPNCMRRINFTFTDSTHIQTLAFRSEDAVEPILCKVYGLKFENKLINRSDIYSEEERLIGRWTDGKPLYQKTFLQNWTSDGEYHIDVTSLHIDKFIKSEGYANRYDASEFSEIVNANYINNINSYKFTVWYSRDSEYLRVLLYMPEHRSSRQSITIQYTKTTDSADSGVIPEDPQMVMMSDYYSEEEQVVGRWTDGKPIYQKTYIFSSSISITNQGASIASYIDNLSEYDTIVDAIGYGVGSGATWCDRIYVDSTGSAWCAEGMMTNRVTIQYTKTTDAPGTGPTKGNLIYLPALYSEEEREVGVWTDGKPLYQKTWDFSSSPIAINGGNQWQTLSGVSTVGMSEIIKAECVDYHGTSFNLYVALDGDNHTHAVVNSQINITMYLMRLTLSYTKTTDQPGSGKYLPDGQYAHHYSTSEKVVGTWIDGSTVYERTWDFGSNVSISSSNYYTGFNINSSSMDKILSGKIMNNDGTLYDNASYDPTRNNHTLLGIKPDNNCNVRYLTLQYTKLS